MNDNKTPATRLALDELFVMYLRAVDEFAGAALAAYDGHAHGSYDPEAVERFGVARARVTALESFIVATKD
jgi:hypothetical protein